MLLKHRYERMPGDGEFFALLLFAGAKIKEGIKYQPQSFALMTLTALMCARRTH